ncbi:hypothetical protein GW17_00048910 [Ensete ventricosum]|nr:hypothetical protein GW17_00048910 [Ensete ventricosum]
MRSASEFAEQALAGSGPCTLARGLLGTEWELVRMSGDSELDLGGRLLEWWSPDEEGVLQFRSAADPCKKVGCGSFYSGCYRSFVPDNLTAFMTYHAAVPSHHACYPCNEACVCRWGCRPYLCQVDCTTTGAPRISDRLPASSRPCGRASCPRV